MWINYLNLLLFDRKKQHNIVRFEKKFNSENCHDLTQKFNPWMWKTTLHKSKENFPHLNILSGHSGIKMCKLFFLYSQEKRIDLFHPYEGYFSHFPCLNLFSLKKLKNFVYTKWKNTFRWVKIKFIESPQFLVSHFQNVYNFFRLMLDMNWRKKHCKKFG